MIRKSILVTGVAGLVGGLTLLTGLSGSSRVRDSSESGRTDPRKLSAKYRSLFGITSLFSLI